MSAHKTSVVSSRRERILDAAMTCIREGGLEALTQPQVAARAGLRHGHLTYYYPTRADLLGAVCERIVEERVYRLRSAADAPTLREATAILARVLVDAEQTRLLLALVQTADREPAVAQAFAGLRRETRTLTAALLTAHGLDHDDRTIDVIQATSTGIAVIALATATARGEDLVTGQLRGLFASLTA